MYINEGRIMNDFIVPNKKQYTIPVYQRNYEWSKEQCKKLFQDIVLAFKKQKPHFCGSFVYYRQITGQTIDSYIIIDGQQRITTIYILLKALMDCAVNESEQDSIRRTIFNNDRFNPYNINDSTKLKLKPVKSDNKQLLLLMDDKLDQMDKSCDIFRNYALFKQLIEEQLEQGFTIQHIFDGLEWLIIARIELNDNDQPQEIFERINSTGLPLSLSDKIRNFVLMTDIDQERLYDEYWLKIEETVKPDHMNSFFTDYLYFKSDRFPKESEAYDCFKDLFTKGSYTNESILKELVHYSNYYGAFLYGSNQYSTAINEYLGNLRLLKQTTVYLFLFQVFDDFNNKIIDEDEMIKVLRFIQNYSIRRLICEIGSNSLRGLYKSLYSRIFNVSKNKEHYYDSIVSFFIQLTSRDALPDDNAYRIALKHNNLYRKNALCKFLLTSIENQGKEKLVTENLTIEHIMPQNKNLSTYWQKMLGDDWNNVHESYMHTLGNLTITGYNSELGDKPFEEKKQKLIEKETKIIRLYSDILNTEVWNKETIEHRADRLTEEILRLFPIEEPEKYISFMDPRYKEYTCEEPDEASNKSPNYYILLGERVITKSYADMLKSVVLKFYELDSGIIKQMAKDNETLAEWSNIVMFTYDPNIAKGEYKIPNTNIYQATGFSAWYIMTFIKKMLNKFELSMDDFVYSARPKTKDLSDKI